jgi:hypothetical protein
MELKLACCGWYLQVEHDGNAHLLGMSGNAEEKSPNVGDGRMANYRQEESLDL